MGYKVMVCPQSVVYHEGSVSFKASKQGSDLRMYMMHRNDLLMLTKNLGSRELKFRLPVRLILEVLNLVASLIRDRREAVQITRALLWVATHFPKIHEARLQAQCTRRVPDESFANLFARGIVPLLYFVGRRTEYTDLEFGELDRLR